jgi:MYXO-CTERM domain-containing protein
MRRLSLCLAVVAGALAIAPAALADGVLFVTQGGAGVATGDGAFHYVAVPDASDGTLLEKIEASHSQVYWWMRLKGSWGIPSLATGAPAGEGLSRDGNTLVLGSTAQFASPSRFLVVDVRRTKVVRTIVLHGYFSFDALSPDASRMYLIQYTRGPSYDLTHYIVRGYDLRTNRLLPGRIADRTQKSWVMRGSPVTRTYSAGGRWVYTLYTNPGGYPFVHALDTVRGVAHCIRLPWEEDRSQDGLYNLVLAVHDGGRTLAVHWRSGRPWLRVVVGSWRISYPGAGFPWAWTGAGTGGGLALLTVGGLLLWRRRNEKVQEHTRQELGLA